MNRSVPRIACKTCVCKITKVVSSAAACTSLTHNIVVLGPQMDPELVAFLRQAGISGIGGDDELAAALAGGRVAPTGVEADLLAAFMDVADEGARKQAPAHPSTPAPNTRRNKYVSWVTRLLFGGRDGSVACPSVALLTRRCCHPSRHVTSVCTRSPGTQWPPTNCASCSR